MKFRLRHAIDQFHQATVWASRYLMIKTPMKKIVSALCCLCFILSCTDNDDENAFLLGDQDYLVFGQFYGMCAGEGCVETFKLTDLELFEDTVDDYSGTNLNFIKLDNEKFEQVKDLMDYFPQELLSENETILGCPDCADGGGLFIQYYHNGSLKSWRIDQAKGQVPNYLHEFIDEVNNKIQLINN